MYDFFIIGDIQLDHVMIVSDPDIVRTVDDRSHTVTLPFPTKIQVDTAPQIFPGGNAYNAAYSISKLGLSVGIYSVIGNDHEGDNVIQELKAGGIETKHIVKDKDSGTNKSMILNIASDRIVFSHHHLREYSLAEIPNCKYVYLTSVGEDDLELLEKVAEQKEQKGYKIIFSPGTRQIEEPFTEVRSILEHTDILVLNKREAQALSRLNSDSNKNLLQGLHRFGPKIVVMTRSNRGSIAFDGEVYTEVGALKVDGLDTTGAGDTYSSTLGAALLMEKDLKTAMEWGAINSAHVISAMGSTNGLLDKNAIETLYPEMSQQLEYIDSPYAVTQEPVQDMNAQSNPDTQS